MAGAQKSGRGTKKMEGAKKKVAGAQKKAKFFFTTHLDAQVILVKRSSKNNKDFFHTSLVTSSIRQILGNVSLI